MTTPDYTTMPCGQLFGEYLKADAKYNKIIYSSPYSEAAAARWTEELREVKVRLLAISEELSKRK